MKEYIIYGRDKDQTTIVEAKFKIFNNYLARKKFLDILANSLTIEEGDIYDLINNETGKIIQTMDFKD